MQYFGLELLLFTFWFLMALNESASSSSPFSSYSSSSSSSSFSTSSSSSPSLSLFAAAQRNNLDAVKKLLDTSHAHESTAYSLEIVKRALDVAIINDAASVVRHLLPLVSTNRLHIAQAAKYGSAQVVSTLVELEGAEHGKRGRLSAQRYAMECACYSGDKLQAQRLVEIKVQFEWFTLCSPLYYAVSGGRARVVLLLLQKKASLGAPIGHGSGTMPGDTALQLATRCKHTTVVRLLERALDPDRIKKESQRNVR